MKYLLAVLCLTVAACAWDNPAPLQKPQPGYPCGTGYLQCRDGMCCGIGYICGGDPGCPPGSCCFVGAARAARDAGAE